MLFCRPKFGWWWRLWTGCLVVFPRVRWTLHSAPSPSRTRALILHESVFLFEVHVNGVGLLLLHLQSTSGTNIIIVVCCS